MSKTPQSSISPYTYLHMAQTHLKKQFYTPYLSAYKYQSFKHPTGTIFTPLSVVYPTGAVAQITIKADGSR